MSKDLMVKLSPCLCTNTFQDRKYGKGKRVWNRTKKGQGSVWRCTVCGREE